MTPSEIPAVFISEIKSAPLAAKKIIGRREELEKIARHLEQEDNLLLLNGMGGVGKTTLAGFYLQEYGHRYRYLAWVPYTGHFRGDLLRALRRSRLLNMPDIANEEEAFGLLLEKLDELGATGPGLLVVDNLNTEAQVEDVAQYKRRLPQGWKVLLTARANIGAFPGHEIGVLDEAEAAELFRRYYHFRAGDTEAQLHELLRRVGRHTLAVELLARTLAEQPQRNLAGLITHLAGCGLTGLDTHTGVTTAHSREQRVLLEHYIAAIFEVNIESLGPEARATLAALSWMPVQPHPFGRLCRLLDAGADDAADRLAGQLRHLTRNGLLEQQPDAEWTLHPVLQAVIRGKWPASYDACAALLAVLKSDLDTLPLPEALPLLPYADAVCTYLKLGAPRLARLCWTISDRYSDIGNFPDADRFIEAANRMYREAGDRRNMAATFQHTGDLSLSQGRIAHALECFSKGNALCETGYSEQPESDDWKNGLAISYERLGAIFQAQGKFEEALGYFEKDMKLTEELYASNPHSENLKNGLAISYEKLGDIFQVQGKFEEALGYFEKRAQLGEELHASNPRSESLKNGLAISFYKIAGLYLAWNKPPEAVVPYEKCLLLARGVHENNPLNVTGLYILAFSCKDLGDLYLSQQRPAKGLPLLREAVGYFEDLCARTGLEAHKNALEKTRQRLREVERTF